MPRDVRVCLIGGGSYNWSPVLLADLALTPDLRGSIVLYDIDAEAAEELRQLGSLLFEAAGSGLRVTTETSLDRALTGSDIVVTTITTGGLSATALDLSIPRRYGIFQSVGDTVGPGGLARALRNIPVLVDIARTMERVCPEALLLNLTNPMTTIVRAITKATQIRTIGLCHELFGTRRALRALFASDDDAVELQVAGINHLIWILGGTIGRRQVLPLLQAHLAQGGEIPLKPVTDPFMLPFQDRWTLKRSLFLRYGVLPAAGDRHLAECFPHILVDEHTAERRYGVLLTTIEHRRAMLDEARRKVRAWIEGDALLPLRRSEEELASIVAAIAEGRSVQAIVNLPNTGQIDNLPRGAVVETFGMVGADRADGICVGNLPPAVLSAVLPHVINQELIVDAALTGDKEAALQALANDALVRDPDIAPRLLDELLEAHTPYLPQFTKGHALALA